MDHNKGSSMEKDQPDNPPSAQAVVTSSLHEDLTFDSDDARLIGGIGVAVLYLVSGGPIGILGVITMAAAIALLLVPDLFPDRAKAYEGLSNKISVLTIPAIEQALIRDATSNANAALIRNIVKCQRVSDQFEIWKTSGDPDRRDWAKATLQADYTALTRDYLPDMLGAFTSDLYRGILVPQYVASAALYLPIIKCYFEHGEALGITPRPGFSTIEGEVLAQFRRDLAEITDIATASYKNGLQKLIVGSPNYPRTWSDYNNYRNTVTRTGLDLLAGLVFLDPIYYPFGCSAKHINRHLYTFVDTSYGKQMSSMTRNIASLEKLVSVPIPVTKMESLELEAGRFTHNATLRHRIDGLYRAMVTSFSIDGYHYKRYHPPTGRTPEGATVENLQNKTTYMVSPCMEINGRYWNGSKNESTYIRGQGYLKEPYTHAMTYTEVLIQSVDRKTVQRLPFPELNSRSSIGEKSATNTFISEFNPIKAIWTLPDESIPLHYQYGDCLADVQIIEERTANLHHYAFSWTNLNAVLNLLPQINHVDDPEKNPVEQYHAIKAARSIDTQNLKIIAGPGFTGGDLVEVPGGSTVNFEFNRLEEPWFNGHYRVRLWVINPNAYTDAVRGVVNVDLLVTPHNSVASRLLASIQIGDTVPDLNNIKFADLMSIPLNGTVLIPAWVESCKLEFRNTTLGLKVILDRIELTFDRVATFADVNDANPLNKVI